MDVLRLVTGSIGRHERCGLRRRRDCADGFRPVGWESVHTRPTSQTTCHHDFRMDRANRPDANALSSCRANWRAFALGPNRCLRPLAVRARTPGALLAQGGRRAIGLLLLATVKPEKAGEDMGRGSAIWAQSGLRTEKTRFAGWATTGARPNTLRRERLAGGWLGRRVVHRKLGEDGASQRRVN